MPSFGTWKDFPKVQIGFCVCFLSGPLFERLNKNRQEHGFQVGGWTTHLKKMIVKLGSSSLIFGVKIPKKICELPPAIGIYYPKGPSTAFPGQSRRIGKATCLFEVNTHWYIRLGVQSWQNRGSRIPVSLDETSRIRVGLVLVAPKSNLDTEVWRLANSIDTL